MWQFGNDSIRIWYTKNGKQKTLDVFTPQSGIIENIIERALHIAGKRGALPAAFTAKNNKIVAGLGKLAQKASEVSMSGGATRFDQARQKRQENAMQFKTVDVVKQGGVAEIEDAEDV